MITLTERGFRAIKALDKIRDLYYDGGLPRLPSEMDILREMIYTEVLADFMAHTRKLGLDWNRLCDAARAELERSAACKAA